MLGEYGRFQVLSGHRSRIWKHFNAPTHTDGESSCGVVALCPCQSTSFTRPECHSIKPPYDRFLILFSLIPLHPCMYCMALIHSFVEYFNIVILSHSILSIRLFRFQYCSTYCHAGDKLTEARQAQRRKQTSINSGNQTQANELSGSEIYPFSDSAIKH